MGATVAVPGTVSTRALVGIAVAAYNEVGNITGVLERVLRSRREGFDLEVLGVSDASTDGTDDGGKELSGSAPVRLLRQPHLTAPPPD